MTTAIDAYTSVNAGSSIAGTAAAAGSPEAGSADRFLKLLVTQMQNQDPLNPMDNAQVTSQMAQINTVTGIETLNTTVQGLNAQFLQMQALQGAALVGSQVTVKGNHLDIEAGTGVGAFELAGTADRVKIEILDATGRVVETLPSKGVGAGTHSFAWDAGSLADGSSGYTFRVSATAGAAGIAATPLMLDRVGSVSMNGSTLTLDLERSGQVAYGDVKAFN